jgi:hypothetical protein
MNNINKNDEPMFLTVTMSETVITYLLLNFWLHLLNFSIISLLVESKYCSVAPCVQSLMQISRTFDIFFVFCKQSE